MADRALKRAITLGGGGPAAGLHLGILKYLEENTDIRFNVWALSCIGAWVGIIYNQYDKSKADQTYDFFRNGIFRDDESYEHFPINSVFGPDWGANGLAYVQFLLNPASYLDLPPSRDLANSLQQTLSFIDPKKWTRGDINQWMLNSVLAVNPLTRFLTSMMYLSNVTGLSRIYYPHSTFMKSIDFSKLYNEDRPYLYHNAWNLTRKRLDLFSNRPIHGRQYQDITSASLCACSALPFVESTVKINGETYCEGALVDTVNFKNLLEDHFDLDEIWISRIVDASQVHEPENLHDSLGNLCELFAATVGEDDVKLFKYHVKEGIKTANGLKKWTGTIVEIHVDPYISFKWNHSNLDNGVKRGRAAAQEAYNAYKLKTGGEPNTTGAVRVINER